MLYSSGEIHVFISCRLQWVLGVLLYLVVVLFYVWQCVMSPWPVKILHSVRLSWHPRSGMVCLSRQWALPEWGAAWLGILAHQCGLETVLEHTEQHDISASTGVNLAMWGSAPFWTDASRDFAGCKGFCHCSKHGVIYLNHFRVFFSDWHVGINGHFSHISIWCTDQQVGQGLHSHVDIITLKVIVITNIHGISMIFPPCPWWHPDYFYHLSWTALGH